MISFNFDIFGVFSMKFRAKREFMLHATRGRGSRYLFCVSVHEGSVKKRKERRDEEGMGAPGSDHAPRCITFGARYVRERERTKGRKRVRLSHKD